MKVVLLWICCLMSVMLYGKTVKTVTVSQGQSYTDHIAMAKDATDKDIMVKFQFNEDANTLTVSVISYRTLFVFWDDTRYKNVFKGRWLRTDQLPYIATAEEGQHFRLSKALRKQLPRPRKSHIFKKWMTYEGLQPQERDIKMVNSYLEQTFDIQNKRNEVVVGLHDIMLLDVEKQSGTKTLYSIGSGADLDTEYRVTIQRNPCFGLEQETENAKKALDAVTKSLNSLKKNHGKGTVSNADAKKAFDELKAALTAQYQHNNDSSACPAIQDCIDRYNLAVDTLSSMTVSIAVPDVAKATEKVLGTKGSEKNGKIVLANAREIDRKVARWLSSRDATERADLIRECQTIINDTKLLIGSLPQSQNEAARLFRQAELYFKKTCR